jgi:hypothetical protein
VTDEIVAQLVLHDARDRARVIIIVLDGYAAGAACHFVQNLLGVHQLGSPCLDTRILVERRHLLEGRQQSPRIDGVDRHAGAVGMV